MADAAVAPAFGPAASDAVGVVLLAAIVATLALWLIRSGRMP